MNKDLQKMFLILAGAAAIASGKLTDKRTMQDVNQASRVELINKSNLNQNTSALTAQKCQLILTKAEKIIANLQLENLQNKPAEAQQAGAFQLLKYLIYNTENDYRSPDQTASNQFEAEVDLIYHTLCTGKNIDFKAQSVTLNFLYQMCGLDSQHATIQKEASVMTKSGKKSTMRQHEIVLINFTDGERICDPMHTQYMQGPALRQNWSEAAFFEIPVYFGHINPNYKFANQDNATALSTDLIQTFAHHDATRER